MIKRHPQADLLQAIADGKQIQRLVEAHGFPDEFWEDISHSEALSHISKQYSKILRVKPEPKPDIIRYVFVEPIPKLDNAFNKSNLKLTFDGETHKLKSAEIL